MAIAILVGAIAAWGVVHSWLASLAAKRAWGRLLGEPGSRAYRLGYNVWAVLSFIPVLWLVRVLPDRTLYFVGSPWRYVMLAVEAAAACLLGLSLLETDPLHFIGLRQVIQPDSASRLVTHGFYGWVRHPLYLFGLMILWLTPFMSVNVLTLIIALTVYVLIGARFEERRLMYEFGVQYRAYQERTPMLVPGLRWGRRPPGQTGRPPKG
jgi:protein-S-isoprenylcysteine O-methyltransferase Ste14